MRNAFKIYGFQHCVNNLNADVHRSLKHWPQFWIQLKNFEQLLRYPPRRRRFVFTCLRGTPLEVHQSKFKTWNVLLYEPRWHCVLAFLKRLAPLLHVFRLGWDQVKYERGVDTDSALAKEWEAGETVASDDTGKFDPGLVTSTIHSAFFNRYVAFAIKADEVPERKLASWAEQCVCHRPLLQDLSEYLRRKMFVNHFGLGVRTCPMSGKVLPEIIDGQLGLVMNESWAEVQEELLTGLSAELHPLEPEDLEFYKQEVDRARIVGYSLLFAKCDYLFRLPMILIGLAVVDEDRARAIGSRCKLMGPCFVT